MIVLFAAATMQTGIAVTNARAAEPVVVTLEQPSSTMIDTAPQIVTGSRIARPYPQTPPVVVPVRLRVTAGNRVLFDDVLRVAANSGASHTESRHEAGDAVCFRPGHYGSGERHALNINLSWRQDATVGTAVNVSVNWQRPSEGSDPCVGEGTRTVALSQTVPLSEGGSQTIRGDGGLAVTISRP